MTLRKIGTDNIVKYVSKPIHSESEKSHYLEHKTASTLRKQNKKLSQNNKSFLKNITGGGLKTAK